MKIPNGGCMALKEQAGTTLLCVHHSTQPQVAHHRFSQVGTVELVGLQPPRERRQKVVGEVGALCEIRLGNGQFVVEIKEGCAVWPRALHQLL